jgi:transposase
VGVQGRGRSTLPKAPHAPNSGQAVGGLWESSPIHRGGAVKDFLANGAASRRQLEQLPGYAPDLNPDEGI